MNIGVLLERETIGTMLSCGVSLTRSGWRVTWLRIHVPVNVDDQITYHSAIASTARGWHNFIQTAFKVHTLRINTSKHCIGEFNRFKQSARDSSCLSRDKILVYDI